MRKSSKVVAATIGIHVVSGLCCFYPFWLTWYGIYGQNWQGAYAANVWMPLLVVGFGCAIAAFGISFLGSRFLCHQCPKWIPAVVFSLGFLLSTLSSLARWGNEDGQWKMSVVGLPITLAIFALSYWGGTVGSRVKPHPTQ